MRVKQPIGSRIYVIEGGMVLAEGSNAPGVGEGFKEPLFLELLSFLVKLKKYISRLRWKVATTPT